MEQTETDQLTEKWLHGLKKATDFDSWGQLVEAGDEYARLMRQIRSKLSILKLDDEKKMVLSKVASCLEIRANFLKSENELEEFRLEDIKRLSKVLESFRSSSPGVQLLPKEMSAPVDRLRKQQASETVQVKEFEANEETDLPLSSQGKLSSLLPKLNVEPGLTLVTVNIVKIGLKDAADHIDPVITVSCKDLNGVELCAKQTTPTPTSRDDTYLTYDVNVELQMPLEKMSKGTGVVFELYHYKPKRRATSLKCYAFMEIDELKSGPCVIELYNKPYDNKRKKLTLLTKKPLYLHLNLSLEKQH
uniref:Axin interactor, dorsalization-associated protein n=1 Tax=Phallusia mammillata TaxID=59560 RepID=A0A6F9D5C5_9ASCI|nr:axin interactor, dorsalization-associated protein [Phallusia mammillata]